MPASDRLQAVADAVTSAATARSAAEAMAQRTRLTTASYLGGDLSMSRLRAGPVQIEPRVSGGAASVEISGAAYTLIDKGRRRATPARAARGSALATPWGPRTRVAGSTTAGHDLTNRHASEVFEAGAEAITAAMRGV